jgi:hypothetical protein
MPVKNKHNTKRAKGTVTVSAEEVANQVLIYAVDHSLILTTFCTECGREADSERH